MTVLRIVFMGTPDFAVPTLAEIVGAGHDVVCVYTQPPRPAGRGMEERRSAVHEFALSHALPVQTPATLREADAQALFAAHDADVAVVVAYGLLLPQPVLDAPHYGCLNLHGSMLPRWRGAAPIQRAIMAGDKETGVAVMRMEAGLDTGPVCVRERLAIGDDMTAGELHDRLALTGASLMVRALSALARDTLACTPQSEDGVVYAAKIDKAEARIDWTRPALEVHNLVRGLSPFPGAWFGIEASGKTQRVKVLRTTLVQGSGKPGDVLDDTLTVACGSGAIQLLQVQRAGKGLMTAQDFLRGSNLPAGSMVT